MNILRGVEYSLRAEGSEKLQIVVGLRGRFEGCEPWHYFITSQRTSQDL